MNDEAEKKKAEKHSEQTMEVDRDIERRLAVMLCIQTMEVDQGAES